MKIRPNPFFPKSINELAHALGVYWRELAFKLDELTKEIQDAVISGATLEVKDEGVSVDENTVEINFTGAGITATQTSSGVVEVAIDSASACTSDAAFNTWCGTEALDALSTGGTRNTAFGYRSAYEVTTGDDNTAVGYLAGGGTGSWNTSVGSYALTSNTTGVSNVAVGWDSLQANTTGYSNVAVGIEALYSATTANGNVAVGTDAAYSTTGINNCALGTTALENNSSGTYNTAVGTSAGSGVSTSSYNTCIGYKAGYGGPIGDGNTIIGYHSGTLGSAITNNIVLASGGTIRATFDGTSWAFIGNKVNIATAKTPSSASDTGVAGDICWDANYIYVCTATNTWKRVGIATWP